MSALQMCPSEVTISDELLSSPDMMRPTIETQYLNKSSSYFIMMFYRHYTMNFKN